MIAIQTKYIPPSNVKGSRVKAWVNSDSGHHFSVYISYPHHLSHELVHYAAVKALVDKHKLTWDVSRMTFGGVKNGYVFCFVDSKVEANDE
jgi:hypothetical protein